MGLRAGAGRHGWALALGLSVAGLGCHDRARPVPTASALAVSTRTGVHGMVVFGDQGRYLYHLPMWHGLHAWQIVLEARLDEEGRRLYDAARAAGSPLVTFEPRPFALASLAPGFPMEGTLYQGHFEQGGTPLPSAEAAARVTFTVERLHRVQALDPMGPARPTAEYWLLGGGDAWFGIHVASRAPDFDQLLRLEMSPPTLADPSEGGVVRSPFQNDLEHRPGPGTRWTGRLPDGTEAAFTVLREEYVSTADLGAVP